MSAAATYAARVNDVLAQRTRLRGPQPPGDLFAYLPHDHPLLVGDPTGPLSPNLAQIAAYVEPDDVIIDVGGGAGRMSLPLAFRCRELINVDPSVAMGAGFTSTAARAGIANVRFIHGVWPLDDTPEGDLALVNHVTYLVDDIVSFLLALEKCARRRVLLTVNSPPPPTFNRQLYRLIHGEEENPIPGHGELAAVLWEMGRLPDIRVLSAATVIPTPPLPNRDAALQYALIRFSGEQWALWPMAPELATHARQVLEAEFDTLFAATREGFAPCWQSAGREILLTWETNGQVA